MTETWKEWEGRTVARKYVLGSYLGGSEAGGVFRTRVEGEPTDAIIRLVPVSGAEAEQRLRQWKAASEVNSPSLIRILSAGSTSMEGRELAYAVEEYGEENLAEILPVRALTADETHAMLKAVVRALACAHAKGMVHGSIRPSNIFAVGDRIKLSSDSLRAAGEIPRADSVYDAPEVAANGISAAGDVWSLGTTLLEVLTQHVPAWDTARMTPPEIHDVPEPFRGIARCCLEIDPGKRREVTEILALLEPKHAAAGTGMEAETCTVKEETSAGLSTAVRKEPPQWLYWLAAAVVAVGAILFILWSKPSGKSGGEEAAAVQRTSPETSPGQPGATAPTRTAEKSEPAASGASGRKKTSSHETAPKDDIVEQVMPSISPSARRTISGTIKIRVKVNVDADGNVTDAALKVAGPSKYFARLSLEAARRWKFAPAQNKEENRAWTLLFALKRSHSEATAVRSR